jgi:type VI secretion system Hcp family effector
VTVANGHTLTLAGGQVVTVGGNTGGLTVQSAPVNPRGRAVGTTKFAGTGLDLSVLSVSFASSAGSGAGAGKATFNPFTITRKIDKSSPLLSKYCATGKHFPKVTIAMRKAGKTYVTYTLSNVIISSYQAASEGGAHVPVEHLTLSYTKVSIKY